MGSRQARLRHLGTNHSFGADYDWRATVDGQTGTLFTAGSWVVDDPDGLLSYERHGDLTNLTVGISALMHAVDLDIVHPATGELDETREDADAGSGIVAIKRDDETPVTKLKIHAASSLPAGSKVSLLFTNGDRYKVWKGAAMTDEIISSTTELDATVEHTFYVEGLSKSASESSESIKQIYTVGTTVVEGDEVKFTVVEAEFDVWLNVFIPNQWTDIPIVPPHPVRIDVINTPGNPTTEFNRKIGHGDDRGFTSSFLDNPSNDVDVSQTSSRAHMQITVIPFAELDDDGIKDNTFDSAIGESFNYSKENSVPHFFQGYSEDNRLLPNYDITSQATASASGLDDPTSTAEWIENSQRGVRFSFVGEADNPIVNPSPAINWNFELGVSANGANLLSPKWILYGDEQDGFPGYEIYVRDSDGNEGNDLGTIIYQYDPDDFGRTATDLFDGNWPFIDDEPVSPDGGDIE